VKKPGETGPEAQRKTNPKRLRNREGTLTFAKNFKNDNNSSVHSQRNEAGCGRVVVGRCYLNKSLRTKNYKGLQVRVTTYKGLQVTKDYKLQ